MLFYLMRKIHVSPSVVPVHQNTYVMFSVPHMSSEHHKIINDTLHVVPNNPQPSIDEKSDIPMGVLTLSSIL
jgi:hypothetical protein